MNPMIIGAIAGMLASRKVNLDEIFGENSRYNNNGGSRNDDNTKAKENSRSGTDLLSSSRTGSGELLHEIEPRGERLSVDGGSSRDILDDILSETLSSAGSLSGLSSGYLNYNSDADPLNPSDWLDALRSYFAGQSGYDLTNAQKGEMAFNHDEAVLQRQWQTEMSNTAYQRQVQDMRDAGLNPALAVGGNGAVTPSGSAASVSGVGAGSSELFAKLFDFILGKAQMAMQERIAAAQSSSAEKIAGMQTSAQIRAAEISAGASMYGSDKQYQGTSEQIAENRRQFEATVDDIKKKLRSEAKLNEEQAKTEEEKRKALAAEALLNNTKAKDIIAMRPYVQDYYEAQSESARADASLKMVEAGFKNSLISNGLVHYVMEHYRIEGKVDEVREQMLDYAAGRAKQENDDIHRGVHWIASLFRELKQLYLVDPVEALPFINLKTGAGASSNMNQYFNYSY